METFGQRAAILIRERCVKNRTILKEELPALGITYNTFHQWEIGFSQPGSHYLALMDKAGMDVLWILRGGERKANRKIWQAGRGEN